MIEMPEAAAVEAFVIQDDHISQMAEQLSVSTSHPEFISLVESIRNAPLGEVQEKVANNIAQQTLVDKGVPLPDGFRITTRTFEEPPLPAAHLDDNGQGPKDIFFDGEYARVVAKGKVIEVHVADENRADISPHRIRTEIKNGIQAIGLFVSSEPFRTMLSDLAMVAPEARSEFVTSIILSPEARAGYGVVVPIGMKIQRSAFKDGRPTLFCITKVLPLAYPWHKVTITFDNP